MRRPRRTIRRNTGYTALTITSLMDVMTIILVFLLKHFGVDETAVTPSADLQVPVSSAMEPPRLAVQIVVSTNRLMVDGVPVLDLAVRTDLHGAEVAYIPDEARDGVRIPALQAVLERKAEEARAFGAAADRGFEGEILLQADRRLPFDVVRQVMHTASAADFSAFRFVVLKASP